MWDGSPCAGSPCPHFESRAHRAEKQCRTFCIFPVCFHGGPSIIRLLAGSQSLRLSSLRSLSLSLSRSLPPLLPCLSLPLSLSLSLSLCCSVSVRPHSRDCVTLQALRLSETCSFASTQTAIQLPDGTDVWIRRRRSVLSLLVALSLCLVSLKRVSEQ